MAVIGLGPGDAAGLSIRALGALERSEVVVGYRTYLRQIERVIRGKEVFSFGMRQEMERCRKAVDLAAAGKRVALVSGGDPGIYGMAGPALELLSGGKEPIEVEVIPGVSALAGVAARLGAPLMNDFCAISLSDLLTPWQVIERRLDAAAAADFVIAVYNPRSRGRTWQLGRAREILLRHRSHDTPVGAVHHAYQEGEEIALTTLGELDPERAGMGTTLIIGNSQSYRSGSWMITPRGYGG